MMMIDAMPSTLRTCQKRCGIFMSLLTRFSDIITAITCVTFLRWPALQRNKVLLCSPGM
jgi:hypothetical protein